MKKGRIIDGVWTSVVVNGSLVFAASNEPPEVYVLEYLNFKWSKVRSFKTNGIQGRATTIAISNDNIVSCSVQTNDSNIYSVQGKVQSVFGKLQPDVTMPRRVVTA